MPLNKGGRGGFSLVEAVVVLAITSVLLVLVFGMMTRSREAGFRIARRANAQADADVGAESLRVLLRGVRLPQRGRWPGAFSGEPEAITAYFAPARATACAISPALPATLRIEMEGGRSRVLCRTIDGRSASVLDLGPGAAHFSYALAGRPWTDRLAAQLPPERSPSAQAAPPPTLWIRVAGDGGSEILEAVDSPHPPPERGA